jgi:aryl carrier-like protein
MTHSDWQSVISPKADGAWNIHNAFPSQTLDFLILASSTVAIVDNPGQGNYKAANTFLEAFCQYRHSLGLPASVLSICPIEDVGFVSETPAARQLLKRQGNYFLREADVLDFMELSIFNSLPSPAQEKVKDEFGSWANPAHLIMGLRSEIHLDDPANRCNWKRDRRMGAYHNIHTQITSDTSSNTDELKTFLNRAIDEPDLLTQHSSMDFLAKVIGQRIFRFMLKPEEEVDIGLSLTQIGLDSLMAIELRRWFNQAFGVQISVLEIMATGTLDALGRVVAEGVVKKLKGSGVEGA